jgi:hypothetical protein
MSVAEFRNAVIQLRDRYQDYLDGKKAWEKPEELAQVSILCFMSPFPRKNMFAPKFRPEGAIKI